MELKVSQDANEEMVWERGLTSLELPYIVTQFLCYSNWVLKLEKYE
jgi:hypothetical protein